jgi:hypothetical protein
VETCLENFDIPGLRTFRTRLHVETHWLTFLEALKSVKPNCGIMHEQVFSGLGGYESPAFRRIEKLYNAFQPLLLFHLYFLVSRTLDRATLRKSLVFNFDFFFLKFFFLDRIAATILWCYRLEFRFPRVAHVFQGLVFAGFRFCARRLFGPQRFPQGWHFDFAAFIECVHKEESLTGVFPRDSYKDVPWFCDSRA